MLPGPHAAAGGARDELSRGTMGEIVNLNKRRKQAERLRKEHLAAQNRRKFGRSKAERTQDKAESDRETRTHESHQLDK
jgi:hypothetical protein